MVYLVLVFVLLCLLEPEDSLHWKLTRRRLCFCVWVCTPLIVLWTSAELVGFLLEFGRHLFLGQSVSVGGAEVVAQHGRRHEGLGAQTAHVGAPDEAGFQASRGPGS